MASLESDPSDKYLIQKKILKILQASQTNSIKEQDLADRFEMPCEDMYLYLMQLEFSELIRRISDSPSSWAIRPASNDDSLETDAEPSASDSGLQQATSLPNEQTSEKEILTSSLPLSDDLTPVKPKFDFLPERLSGLSISEETSVKGILTSNQASSLSFPDKDETIPKQRSQPEAFSDSMLPSSGKPPEMIPKQLDDTYSASGATADITDGARAHPIIIPLLVEGRAVKNSINVDLQDHIDKFTKIINKLVKMYPDSINVMDLAEHVCGLGAVPSKVNKELYHLERKKMTSHTGSGKETKWKFIGSPMPTDEDIKRVATEFAKSHKPKGGEQVSVSPMPSGVTTVMTFNNCNRIIVGNENIVNNQDRERRS